MRNIIIGSLLVIGLLIGSYLVTKPSLCFAGMCYGRCIDSSYCSDGCFCAKGTLDVMGDCVKGN